ncbi:Threonylcarbamoyl-AMP synthase [compost metagenome]|jgi:tRNA A37 threonylcarbamoyladenosine synthetase subunit TsaC/SUA5/YrdC
MISTSANISGQENLQNSKQIIDTFDDIDLAYYDALSGDKIKPSAIIDLESRKVIRE